MCEGWGGNFLKNCQCWLVSLFWSLGSRVSCELTFRFGLNAHNRKISVFYAFPNQSGKKKPLNYFHAKFAFHVSEADKYYYQIRTGLKVYKPNRPTLLDGKLFSPSPSFFTAPNFSGWGRGSWTRLFLKLASPNPPRRMTTRTYNIQPETITTIFLSHNADL